MNPNRQLDRRRTRLAREPEIERIRAGQIAGDRDLHRTPDLLPDHLERPRRRRGLGKGHWNPVWKDFEEQLRCAACAQIEWPGQVVAATLGRGERARSHVDSGPSLVHHALVPADSVHVGTRPADRPRLHACSVEQRQRRDVVRDRKIDQGCRVGESHRLLFDRASDAVPRFSPHCRSPGSNQSSHAGDRDNPGVHSVL